MLKVKHPTYELGATVFTVSELKKATVFERFYSESLRTDPQWYYKLSPGADQEGNPLLFNAVYTDKDVCLKVEALELVKEKIEAIEAD